MPQNIEDGSRFSTTTALYSTSDIDTANLCGNLTMPESLGAIRASQVWFNAPFRYHEDDWQYLRGHVGYLEVVIIR